jgi:hypothetical protein
MTGVEYGWKGFERFWWWRASGSFASLRMTAKARDGGSCSLRGETKAEDVGVVRNAWEETAESR